MPKNALILVDIQNDFMPGGALPVPKGDKILPAIKRLIALPFDIIVATKDWHPRDHMSFASNHGKQPGQTVMVGAIKQILWPDHCIHETLGAEFYPGWDASKVEKTFYKGTDKMVDSYSTFFDNLRIKSTGLENYLNKMQVKYLFIAGLATDYCVKYSVLDALHLGFHVCVVTDGCKGINLKPDDTKKALHEMEQEGAVLKTSQEIEKLCRKRLKIWQMD